MAVLNANQLAKMRRGTASSLSTLDWDKPIINSALQEIEDWYESSRATVSGLIDTATSPYTFSNPEKKLLAKWWMEHKFGQGG